MEIKKNKKLIILLIIGLFLINLVYALAPPILPDHFKGNLIIDNINAPIGTEIEVKINDELKDTIFTTITGKYDLYVKVGNYNDNIKFKINGLETSTYQRTGGKTFNVDLKTWTDRDSDGIPDDIDKLIGSKGNVSNNFADLSILINNSDNLFGSFNGIKNVKFKDGDKEIVNFDFDFDSGVLNLFELKIDKQSNSEGSIIIKGMPSGVVKTAYIDKLKTNSNSVCIKDAEISLITEISANCDGENEFKVNCPGTNGNYICSVEESRFKISGLSHSGVKEFYIAPVVTTPPASSSSSGGGGGGGSGSATTNIITNSTPENTNITDETNADNNNENTGTSRITGAVVIDFVKSKKGVGIIIIGIIGVLVIFKIRRLILNKKT